MSLGEVDYGLYGVVGGLTAFIAFFNNLMGGAVSRYYAFHVGAASVSGDAGVEECRKWFTTAVVIHTVLPLALVAIGYPLGCWAIKSFLMIPADRVSACIWVWRFVCVSCFVGMMNVPYVAMYTAKQEIAEMSIYSVVQTALNVCVLYYMVTHEGTWLTTYAAWACALSITPQIIMCVRAALIFPECRFKRAYICGYERMKDLAVFASLRFAGACTIMIQSQGMAILTNKILGPTRNAAMTVGNTLSSQSETLAGALDTALSPAITNACGAGDYDKMRSLCFRACKFSAVLMLIFAIPLALEVNEVMRLWLKNPPEFAASLCVCILVCLVLEKLCSGHWMAIFAFGRIGWYQLAMGVCGIVVLPLAWLLMKAKFDLLSVGYALIVGKVLASIIRLWFGRTVGMLPIRKWIREVFLPIVVATCIAFLFGCLPMFLQDPSFIRIIETTFLAEAVFLPLCWFLVLTSAERSALVARVKVRVNRR